MSYLDEAMKYSNPNDKQNINPKKTYEELKKAADDGYSFACFLCGLCLKGEYGCTLDRDLEKHYLEEALKGDIFEAASFIVANKDYYSSDLVEKAACLFNKHGINYFQHLFESQRRSK